MSTRVFRFSPPTRFGSRYRSDLEDADDVRVLLHGNAVELVLDARGERIERMDGAVLDGPRFSVEANTFVLAMGGLENARVLLASSGADGLALANSSGLIGRYFMEHPHLYDSVLWLGTGMPLSAFYERHHSELAGGPVMGVIGLSPETRSVEGLLDLTVSVHSSLPEGAATGPLDVETISALTGTPPATWRLTIRAEQSPDFSSRVTLTDDNDALGMPMLDLHWTIRDEDFRNYRRSVELLGRELAAAGLGRIWAPVDASSRLDWEPRPGGHHMGTTRMSSDPMRGVVDADCRCHDVPNLYVAGSSVFTTGGSANPTLTIVALAERLADHLRSTS